MCFRKRKEKESHSQGFGDVPREPRTGESDDSNRKQKSHLILRSIYLMYNIN